VPIIAPYNREALREQYRRAAPFPFFVIDGFLERDFADTLAASYPSYENASNTGRSFRAVNEMGKVQICEYESFPPAAKRLADAICAPELVRDLEYVTGIPSLVPDSNFIGGGIQETRSRGWLDVHVDFNFLEEHNLFRRLNILVYLNPEWDERWGGELELWDREVRQCHHALAPIHNRCVVLETSDLSFHGVAAVRCPPGATRKSFAAYYYTREAPPGWDGRMHSTLFKARPNEHVKRHLLMPAERAKNSLRERVRRVRRAGRSFFFR
jgi:hypothetical protein